MQHARLPRFLHELKRRRVFRVAIVYAVVAWAVSQVADVFFPALRLPEWALTLVVALSILGFPVALVLAWAFEVTPDGVKRSEPMSGASPRAGSPSTISAGAPLVRRSAWFVLGLLVAFVGAWAVVGREGGTAGEPPLDDGSVAILPFRVSGAAPDLHYLREGMVDLLATKLTGEVGLRAVDTRTAMSAWRRVARDEAADLPQDSARLVARGVGAGHAVLGEVVSAPGRIVLSATLVDVASGRRLGPLSVEGAADSLTSLVDRLAARLLSVEAGEGDRLAQLTSTSLPALRAYLAGQAAYRRGGYDRAFEQYSQALAADSGFALAAVGLIKSSMWTGYNPVTQTEAERARRLAFQSIDRLSDRDRLFFEALATRMQRHMPPSMDQLAAWEAAIGERPDDAEAWHWLGEILYHDGHLLGMDDGLRRAERAFQRALELDSTYLAPLAHLLDIAIMEADREATEARAELYLAREPEEFWAAWRRIKLAVLFGDSADYHATLSALDTVPHNLLYEISRTFWPTPTERVMEVKDRAYDRLLSDARTTTERLQALSFRHEHALNRGRPAAALRDLEAMAELDPAGADGYARMKIADALYWDGDTGAAAAAAAALAAALAADTPAAPAAREEQRRNLCAVEQWRILQGETATAARTIARLRDADPQISDGARLESDVCASMLDALLARHEGRGDLRERVQRLDTTLRRGPPPSSVSRQANHTAARLLQELGDIEGALSAVGRAFAREYGANQFLMHARLAERSGRRDEAVAAYRRYLSLRGAPEPALQDEVRRVRTELEGLSP